MFKKKKYRFDLVQVQNVRTDTIRNAADLVNFIIGENRDLLNLKEKGSLVVSKTEISKKGERILFAQRLNLPMPLKTNFDAFLEPFYTKKPLDFDEKILEMQEERDFLPENMEENTFNRQNELSFQKAPHIQRIENEEDYAPAPQIDLSDAKEESKLYSETKHQAITEESASEQMKEIAQEIEPLNQDFEPEAKQASIEVDASLLPKEKSVSEAFLLTPTIPSDSIEDSHVLDMIQMVKKEANRRLNDFIAQETAKINADIEALDTRDQIELTLTQRFGDEKETKIGALNRKVDLEKAEAISAEKARYEAALESIENDYEANRDAQLTALKEEFAYKLSSAIKEEYERQTEQLNLILQGKTEELQLRQKAVNEGMKKTVSEVLEGFNTNHGEVIQTVERRKNSSSLITLHKRVG